MASVEVKAEITGTVWKVQAAPGDAVSEGDVRIVIESMKMEIPVIAEDAGTIKELRVREGETVTEGMVVAVLEG